MAAVDQSVKPVYQKGTLAAASWCPQQEALRSLPVVQPVVESLQHGVTAAKWNRAFGGADVARDQALCTGAEGGGCKGADAEAVKQSTGEEAAVRSRLS